ncbi:MAG: Histidine kinase [Mucilaginibacter sp.]|nr:Histidine kinase [Mucilaginibacter sp.]
MMKKLIDNRWFLFAMPFVIWFLLLVMPFIVTTENNGRFPEDAHRHFIVDMMTGNFLLLCVFYIHSYLVYPLISKKVLWYVLGLLGLLGLYWLCWHFLRIDQPKLMHIQRFDVRDTLAHAKPFGNKHMMGPGQKRFRIFMEGPGFVPLISPLVAILCSVCYRVLIDNRAKQQLLKERENMQLQSELTFLRSQISPHFMFNTLNNLVALARKKSDDLEPAIVNLSQLMRYMLYESDDNKVHLSKEIEYLKSYINLQMLRFGSSVKVNIDIDGDAELCAIEPMLLIPFVENAFKHGIGMIENPVININISFDADNCLLRFKVENTVSPLDMSKDSNSGIGISNVQRRLAILHPGKHQLDIVNQNNTFIIDLSINLSETKY